jgi:hypothetical protein
VYSGGGAFVSVATDPITHTVAKGDTTTSLASVHTPALFGAVELHVSSAPKAPAAGIVAGTFTILDGAKVVGNGSIVAGSGAVILPDLTVGSHTLLASYGGSNNFLGSDSAAFTIDVTEAPTQLTVTAGDAASQPDGTVVLEILVTALTPAPAVPGGTITITENGVVLTQQSINGSMKATLTLTGGHHTLFISYSGDENFLRNSQQFDLDISKGIAPARRRAVHH